MKRRVTRSGKSGTDLEQRPVSRPTQTDFSPIKIYITDVEAFNKIFHSSDKRSSFPPALESSSRQIFSKTCNSIIIKSSTPKPHQIQTSTTSEVILNKSSDDHSSSDKDDGDNNNETSSSEVVVSDLNSDNRLEGRFDRNIADQMTDAHDGSMLFELSSIFNSSVALPDLLTSDETIVDINNADDERNEGEGLSVSPPLLRKRSRSALMDFSNDSDDDERNSGTGFMQTSLEFDEKKGRNLSFHIRSSTVVVHNHYYKQL